MRSRSLCSSVALGMVMVLPSWQSIASPQPEPTKAAVQVTELVSGLRNPWALAFLPDGQMLITEKSGNLRVLNAEGQLSEPLGGTPEVADKGQGGLLDVVLSPSFEQDRFVYLSYAESDGKHAGTVVGRGRLAKDLSFLEAFTPFFIKNLSCLQDTILVIAWYLRQTVCCTWRWVKTINARALKI